jgi:hypothetical protein
MAFGVVPLLLPGVSPADPVNHDDGDGRHALPCWLLM